MLRAPTRLALHSCIAGPAAAGASQTAARAVQRLALARSSARALLPLAPPLAGGPRRRPALQLLRAATERGATGLASAAGRPAAPATGLNGSLNGAVAQQQKQQQQQQQQVAGGGNGNGAHGLNGARPALAVPPAAPLKSAAAPPMVGGGSASGPARGAGPNPISTEHPSILPLRVEGGRVLFGAPEAGAAAPAAAPPAQKAGTERVLMDRLVSWLASNPRDAPPNGLVFGVSSQKGPVSQLDSVVGSLNFRRFLACARNKLWWMTPEWGSALGALPPETQFLLLELEEPGTYGLVLPLIDGDFRATLRPNKSWQDKKGELCIRVESGDDTKLGESFDSVLLLLAGTDPYYLVDAGVAAAAALSGGAKPRSHKRLPPSLDAFGWCTWDAFYSTVSARGLAEGLASLHSGGVYPRLLIIDDGWQLTDVDAPYAKAPTSQLAERMKVKGSTKEFVETTQDDFYSESARLLAEATKRMEIDQEIANAMPTVANVGEAPHHAHRDHHTSDAAGGAGAGVSAPGAGSASAAALAALREAEEERAREREAARERAGMALLPNLEPPRVAVSPRQTFILIRWAQKFAGALVGLGTAAFLLLYQWVVEPAPYNSMRTRAWVALTQGVLRGAMLSFYSSASDFTRRLTSVAANGKFSRLDAGPEEDWEEAVDDFKGVVAHIKSRFDVRYVMCWHGLPAYWGGIMPGAPALEAISGARIVYPKPTEGIAEIEPSLMWSPAVLAGVGIADRPAALYGAMHSYLEGCGVDGVKVDCQAGVGLVGSALGGGPAASREFQAALEGSVREHFPDNHCINCMCHSTENMYRFADTAVARVSDDFYPRDAASSTPHIAACAFNSVYMGALVQPDWDMFQSAHPAAKLHGMARAVSGGAVYVSDKPGQHDFELLRRLVLPDGTVLRARLPGRPTRDSLFRDPLRDGQSLLKVWNANAVVGVVGVFNVQGASWDRVRRKFLTHNRSPPALSTEVRASDVEVLRPGGSALAAASGLQQQQHERDQQQQQQQQQQQHPRLNGNGAGAGPDSGADSEAEAAGPARPTGEFAAYEYTSRRLSLLPDASAPLRTALEAGGSDTVWFSPVLRRGGVKFAPLGLADMYNGGGAVTSVALSGGRRCQRQAQQPQPESSGAPAAVATVGVRGCGKLLMYSSVRPAHVWVNLAPRDFEYEPYTGRLEVEVPRASEGLEAELEVMF